MRIVLDINSLIQCLGIHSPYRGVWLSILSGTNTLCVSNEIISEYEEILQRFFRPDFAEAVLHAILKSRNVMFFSPHYHFNLIQVDPDDNKFVDCAIQANARFIVTNDHHYDILRQIEFPRVDIITLAEFLRFIQV